MTSNQSMKAYSDPSHLGIGKQILEDAVEYLNQTPDQEFPLSEDSIEDETGVKILGYRETLEQQSYTILEQNGELHIDRIQSFDYE